MLFYKPWGGLVPIYSGHKPLSMLCPRTGHQFIPGAHSTKNAHTMWELREIVVFFNCMKKPKWMERTCKLHAGPFAAREQFCSLHHYVSIYWITLLLQLQEISCFGKTSLVNCSEVILTLFYQTSCLQTNQEPQIGSLTLISLNKLSAMF